MLKNVGARERASSMEKNQGKIKYWYAYPLLYVKNHSRINLDFLKVRFSFWVLSRLAFHDFVAVSWASQSTCDNYSELRGETHITKRTQAVICVSLDQEILFNDIH